MSKKAKSSTNAKTEKVKKPRIRVVSGESEAPSTQPETPENKTRKKSARKDGKMSGLEAAAKVLADAKAPLNAKEILDRIQEAGLWKTEGKTPHATIYSAIIREIGTKGGEARFRKAERGRFTTA